MKVQKVKIQNFKGISKEEVNLNGCNIYLKGPNEAGKTTFIDACLMNMPSNPLKTGERRGEVIVEVDGYVIERKFTEKNPKGKLNIFDKTGRPQKSPATLLKDLFGVQDFEIDSFLKLPLNKKVEFIKQVAGVDFKEIDERYDEVFEDRKWSKKELESLENQINGVEYKEGLKEVDVSTLQTELRAANENNTLIERCDNKKVSLEEDNEAIEQEIERLKIALSENKKAIEKCIEWRKGKDFILPQPIEDKITNASQINKEYAQNEEVKVKRLQAVEVATKINDQETELEEIKATKKEVLSQSSLDVKGLEFDEEGLYLDGLPFESSQINTARRIVAGLEIQYALLGEVKVARFDGSLLDNKSLKYVHDWAETKGIQLFIEMVDRDCEELKIEVEEC